MAETWLPVPGFEATYSVSDLGRVRREKPSRGTWPGRISNGGSNGHYQTVSFDPPKKLYIHHLVAAAFLGPRSAGLEINHKNGDKRDNKLANLEYMTRRQNVEHSTKLDTYPRGSQRAFSKLTEADVQEIRTLWHLKKMMQKDIATKFGVPNPLISKIVNRQKWKHVP